MSESKVPGQEPQFAALVGIDWADQKHAWCLQAADATQRENGEVEHTPEAIEAFVGQLCRRFGHRPIAVAVEQVKGALVFMLSKYGPLHLFPVPPAMSAKMREALYPSGSKDDPRDADLLLELLLQHRDKLRRLSPDSEATRRVQNLVEERRNLVDEKTAQTNRLTNQLKIYFPQMLEWFEQLDTELVCTLLERWPTLEELQKVPPARLRTFFYKQRCRYPELIERRLVGIRQAMPAIRDVAVIEAKSAAVKVSAQVIRSLVRGIADLDRKIEEAAAAHPDFFIFESLPESGGGAGAPLVGGIWLAAGTLHQRRGSANLQWDRAGDETEWEKEVGTFSLGLSEVFAAELSRMGRSFHRPLAVGAQLLSTAAGAGQGAPRRGARFGLQVDSHRFPLLERWGGL